MLDSIAPNNPDLASQLPADAYCHLLHTLRLTLPPPPFDRPEDWLRRDHAAIARIAALAPANAAEADLAAQFVAASEQWKDCLRLAQAPETSPEWAHKCRAQANAMMRQANAALRLLLRMQETRRKLESDNAAADRLAWTEHCATALMAEALAAPPLPARPDAGTVEPAAAMADPPDAGPANHDAGRGEAGPPGAPEAARTEHIPPSQPIILRRENSRNETRMRHTGPAASPRGERIGVEMGRPRSGNHGEPAAGLTRC